MAITDLRDLIQSNLDSGDMDPDSPVWNERVVGDLISELADTCTPIYTSDLLAVARADLSLATDTPELGPAFDGEPTPANIIAANVYERLHCELWQYWQEIRDFEEMEIAFEKQVFEGLGL